MSGTSGPDGPDPGQQSRAQRSARLVFCTTVLALEAFVVLFASLVAFGLDLAEPAVVWTVGGIAAVVFLLLAGLVRYRAGLVLGSVMQVALIASGLVIPMMFFVGGIFAVIWIVALRLGRRIDVERAERAHAGRDAAAGRGDLPSRADTPGTA